MVRKLKHHEGKLLKKVDFLNWKQDSNLRQIKVMRRYHIQNREDYQKYNTLIGHLQTLITHLSLLPPLSPFRTSLESQILSKLYDVGVLPSSPSSSSSSLSSGSSSAPSSHSGSAKLSDIRKLTVSAFCRRRLGVVMCQRGGGGLGMAESVSSATRFVEQGHVRVGTEVVRDPAYLVTRRMEDFVTWVDTSKMKRTVMRYNDELDDFDLL
ncbi:alpha-L RNA-binding motif-containing protein [Lentinula boryana]|uniref:Alpha-L RNA-binding motif-containing protein n=1 Tax=Lentinula boryana TaxID=40481 RepID=A0ABQ8PZS0_9AGAR|nr:alpha-L RNA-binding motif-containing protein [Lentinula boryana]